MTIVIYSLIVLFATTIGAISGIGGGIIIKPFMDFASLDNIKTISFYSCHAVFFMALYATTKHIINKKRFDLKILILICLSSIVGGSIGTFVLNFGLKFLSEAIVQITQSSLLLLLILFLIYYFVRPFKSIEHQSVVLILIAGTVLGFISSFLSIGGGPANIAVYSWVLNFNLKLSVIYSLATILFAQGTQILGFILEGYNNYQYQTLFYIVPVAILGGIIGSWIYKRISEKIIRNLLIANFVLVLMINLYNLVISAMTLV